MGKENGAYTNNEILSILKREGNSSVTTWTNLEDIMPSEMSITKGQILCDSTYLRYKKQSVIKAETRMVLLGLGREENGELFFNWYTVSVM